MMQTVSSPCNHDWQIARLRRCGVPERHAVNLRQTHGNGPWRDCYAKIGSQVGQGFLIALIGPRGVGKTQLAVGLAVQVLAEDREFRRDESKMVRYVKALDMFRAIRATFGGGEQSEIQVVESFTRPRLLVIDEAHERAGSEFEGRTLTNIIDHRYDAMRDTLIISNATKEQFGRDLGPSIVSRIQETGECIVCDWPSFRNRGAE